MKPSGAQFAPHAERYSGGHAARWFAATDGQQGDEPFADAHVLCSLAEALDAAEIADQIRSEPEGYWVEPHWLPIASDGAGQHFMIDDRDGRVLAVAHDDDHVKVIAPSPEAWLEALLDGHASGSIVWDEVFGLIEVEKLERVHASQRAHAARMEQSAELPPKHQIGLALVVGVVVVLVLAMAWYLEARR
ncbi:MAG: SMI1/KNR4 family protein [Polyangiaceae bacterium]|nr:SMI1/KNR4 family protein [Polyangiaceae bacterium]